MRSLLIISIVCCAVSLAFSARAECVPASEATPDSACVIVTENGKRFVRTTLDEFDRIARDAAIEEEAARQLKEIREAYKERVVQVGDLQKSLAQQKEATVAADTLAAAERLRADGLSDELSDAKKRANAWYRSPWFGVVLGSAAVAAGGAADGKRGAILGLGIAVTFSATGLAIR
jgi:hypothetical protein